MNEKERASAFSDIYASHRWSGESLSGPGSDPKNTGPYVIFVNEFLDRMGREKSLSIVDIGCGDFSTSRRLNFQHIDHYTGIDIVPSVVEMNKAKWSSDKIDFKCLDCVVDDFPASDIVLIKDVLQHLSNASVNRVLEKIRAKSSYCIVTNDFKKLVQKKRFSINFGWRELTGYGVLNEDIQDGGSRPLDLQIPPFGLKAISEHTFSAIVSEGPPVVKYLKKSLVIKSA